jgi:serine/threonine protein kinase
MSGGLGQPQQILAGRYELIRVIGSGGTGSVWVANDLELQTQVAVKLLSGNPSTRGVWTVKRVRWHESGHGESETRGAQ